jgi:uncharacterized NAD-dependent epimerase/dehydratase family protein
MIWGLLKLAPTATILARGYFAQTVAKTAHGLIRYSRKYKIISVIDETLTGKDAGEVMGIGYKDIPIVADVDLNANVLIIGVAPSGGKLPFIWREDIKKAITNGMDIINGLHDFLNNDPEFIELANEHNVSLIDVRKPPDTLNKAKNIKPSVPVILVSGTDGRCGKRTTALELYNIALGQNVKAGFIATGQTGIMIGCDAGAAVDHLPPAYIAGMIESAVQDVIGQGKELIFVEGQGALLHHAYSTSAIGILHGARPDLIVVSHKPNRLHRASFPEIPVPPIEKEIKALELLSPESKIIALSMNCDGAENYLETCGKYEKLTEILTVDVISDKSGAKKIFDKIRVELK